MIHTKNQIVPVILTRLSMPDTNSTQAATVIHSRIPFSNIFIACTVLVALRT